MSDQLVFDLPHRPALGAGDFLVSACNKAAVALVDAWPEWPQRVQLIEGPSGCGKSHLANVWRHKSGADMVAAATLHSTHIAELPPQSGVILEDLDRSRFNDKSLFHLLNLTRERGISLLLTARVPPARWGIKLPDLISRLRAVPVAVIGPPDNALLRAVLLKHFADRQLNVEPLAIAFLAKHMLRSMETAYRLVAEIDSAALTGGKKISRHFCIEFLKRYQSDESQS